MKKKKYIGWIAAVLAAVFGFGTFQLSDELPRISDGGMEVLSESERSAPAANEEEVAAADDTTATGEMKVTFLDVGQGDCTLVQTGESAMMIDAGNNGAGDQVVEYLREQNIDSLDYLILTHPDADHIGGGDDVLEAVEVKKVIMPNVANDTVTYEEVLADMEQLGMEPEHPYPGEVYELGDARFTILCPEPDAVSENDLNGSSVGIKLVHGENSFVMCGDAEEKAEFAMVERFGSALECDVLKCGHHGSSTATTDAFLEAANPTWAVISCGANNQYGHPHAEVIARLEEEDIQIYRTDQLGTITALSDGETISWSSEAW